jgi:hypothetical protein
MPRFGKPQRDRLPDPTRRPSDHSHAPVRAFHDPEDFAVCTDCEVFGIMEC